MDSISCKECKKCLFINTLQLIIQSSTKYKIWQKQAQFLKKQKATLEQKKNQQTAIM